MVFRVFMCLSTISIIQIEQNWTADESDRLWFTNQGSRITPYKWSLHL